MKDLKVLILNGSPRIHGNTSVAVSEMEKIFSESGVKTETVQIGKMKSIALGKEQFGLPDKEERVATNFITL
ncbi:MAG: NAD(P)H-dependent oxidoreductase [Anaerostipes sp.]|uniref:NAD(P)H-dependent oxidoreductase n=1 Tax=Anaerostipes sp. TaxID=1872530 RepID=UPI0039932386